MQMDALQDTFINHLIQNNAFVSVYLKNSIQLKGHIMGHDEQAIFLKTQGIQIIYKKAGSAVCPAMVFERFETS